MTPSPNRSRITVEQPGKPGLYQPTDLPHWEIVGEVSRGSDRGALVKHRKTGRYAMARAGAITNLPQQKVKAALGEWHGSPPVLDGGKGGKRVNVYLDAPSLDRAAELGEGNVSKGIRKALKQGGR